MANNLSKKFALLCCSMMTMQALRFVISTAGFCVVRFHIDCELFNIFISRLVNAVMMSQLFGNWFGDLIVFGADGKGKLDAAAAANWFEFICFCTGLFSICHTESGHLTGFYWSMVLAYFWWKVSEAPATSIAPGDGTDYYFAGFTLSGVWAAILKWIVMRYVSDGGTKTVHFKSNALGDVNVKVVGARSVKTTLDYRAAKWLFITTIVLTFLMCLPWSVVKWMVKPEAVPGEGTKGVVDATKNYVVAAFVGIAFGGILAVPGAMLGAGIVQVWQWFRKNPASKSTLIVWGIVGALGGMATGLASMLTDVKKETWIETYKWEAGWGKETFYWPIGGLGVGLGLGASVGLCIGACKGSKKRGTAAGAFIGSFVGLLTGEMVSGHKTWSTTKGFVQGAAQGVELEVVNCGIFIVVAGLGTVYSIYPGMAPCSITQFEYFNIIDVLILALSAIAPLVIMGVDLADQPWKLGKVIKDPAGAGLSANVQNALMGSAIGIAVFMVIGTLICEIIVICVMQHPFSKLAQKVTTSGWRAVLLTVTMVTFQLTSSGVGFACVAAGSGFNDGVVNVNSTLTLWTIECCAVLGEGYLTQLKKYEKGMWPTQGMGKWDSYWWWSGKSMSNAWQIWCCIGTTDLRRDIMLCRQ